MLAITEVHTKIGRITARTKKLQTETYWYPLVLVSCLVITIITLTKLFL